MNNLLRLPLENDSNEEYMALINGDNEKIEVIVVSCQTQTINPQLSFTIKNSKKFIKKIPALFKHNFKAVILNLFHIHQSACYSSNLKLCEAARAQFVAIKVPHFFTSGIFIELSTFLVAAEIGDNVQNGDIVVIVKKYDGGLYVFELTFSKINGFEISDRREIPIDNEVDLLTYKDEVKELIVGSGRRPIKIILDNPAEHPLMQILKNQVLQNDPNVFEFIPNRDIQIPKFLSTWTKWLNNKIFNQYFIVPYCMGDYTISLSRKGSDDDFILGTKFQDPVPLEKSAIVPKCFTKCFLKFTSHYCKEIPLEDKCHQNRVTLIVDAESFPSWKVEPIFLSSVQSFSQKLDTVMDDKIPIIGFFDECSVICVAKNDRKNNYKFLDTWNGQFGNPLAISFEKDKPMFCKDALQTYNTKPTYFVFDLLKIMSMPTNADAIKSCPSWKFKVTNDDENPVLLEFDTFEDGRKAAPPAFLMAMLLRQHIKAIRGVIGAKPKIFGFCLLTDFGEDEEEKIQKQLKETCQLLNIECVFVKLFN